MLLATLFALFSTSLASHVHDPEEIRLERNLRRLEREFFSTDHHRHHRLRHEHQGHHHRHHRRPLLGLLRSRYLADPPVGEASPSSHPAMRNLKKQQQAAEDARHDLEENIQNAMVHLNSVSVLKNTLAKTRIKLVSEERRLLKLKEEQKQLDVTHHSLSQSLKRVMEPKLEFVEDRLLRKEHELKKLQAEDAALRERVQKYHSASLAMIKERSQDKADLQAALTAEEKAHQDTITSERRYKVAKQEASSLIEHFGYSQTSEQALRNKEQHYEEEMKQARSAFHRLSSIMALEQKKVDQSMAKGQDRLKAKIRRLERATEESNSKVVALKEEYSEWQARQKAWTDHLAVTREGAEAANQDYANARAAVFATQRQDAVDASEPISDWAWDERAGTDDKKKKLETS